MVSIGNNARLFRMSERWWSRGRVALGVLLILDALAIAAAMIVLNPGGY